MGPCMSPGCVAYHDTMGEGALRVEDTSRTMERHTPVRAYFTLTTSPGSLTSLLGAFAELNE
jgi:hypothetical protein